MRRSLFPLVLIFIGFPFSPKTSGNVGAWAAPWATAMSFPPPRPKKTPGGPLSFRMGAGRHRVQHRVDRRPGRPVGRRKFRAHRDSRARPDSGRSSTAESSGGLGPLFRVGGRRRFRPRPGRRATRCRPTGGQTRLGLERYVGAKSTLGFQLNYHHLLSNGRYAPKTSAASVALHLHLFFLLRPGRPKSIGDARGRAPAQREPRRFPPDRGDRPGHRRGRRVRSPGQLPGHPRRTNRRRLRLPQGLGRTACWTIWTPVPTPRRGPW